MVEAAESPPDKDTGDSTIDGAHFLLCARENGFVFRLIRSFRRIIPELGS